ncbi:3-dehydroquinate synthase [Leptothoe sp. PORK10 BA2]|uniref:3-dehydroquinate synthase n=1 Tax=Leptothoe sp. PORK10 BA2 TaxID=3110254 RepID=UPI002B21D008|nr:3-dehydroquinate synthase [Leptothoe sp. PORK10 BA2]MEA5465092.1 3-dehydroquinate synthase [Leptothoe sp. PORK10 BA2]
MKTVIPVELPQLQYDIKIATDGLQYLGSWLSALGKRGKVLLVSNPAIFKHYGGTALTSLIEAGFDVCQCILPPGERYKTLRSIEKIYNVAFENHLERSSTMVALGGGVIGDMTGFAAATWLRGIGVVQVPTSLLAMVDASMGGKTGVNHPQGKNLIGAFHQPSLVLIDPNVLATLPGREFRAGMAEVIKYGIIWNEGLFDQLEQAKRLDQMRYVGEALLHDILKHSCQAKADVVSQDEKEAGLRAILNYGHTVGHAVESLTGYKLVNHGEAVGIGMVAAGAIATALGHWPQTATDRQLAMIKKAGLPTQLPSTISIDDILVALRSDKKVKSGKVRFVLPKRIGEAFVTDQVTDDIVRSVLEKMV